jgi:hypothetical protein
MKSQNTVQSRGEERAGAQSNNASANALAVQSLHWLAKDLNGSHLVNFPFAFAIFMILMTGSMLVGLGVVVTNAWLAIAGVLITLVGSFLHGWSLYDD